MAVVRREPAADRQGPEVGERYDDADDLDAWTADKELAALWNAGGGSALIWRISPRYTAAARGEAYYYRYRNFAALRNMTALIAGVTVSAHW